MLSFLPTSHPAFPHTVEHMGDVYVFTGRISEERHIDVAAEYVTRGGWRIWVTALGDVVSD